MTSFTGPCDLGTDEAVERVEGVMAMQWGACGVLLSLDVKLDGTTSPVARFQRVERIEQITRARLTQAMRVFVDA